MHFDVFDTAQPDLAAELVAGVRRFNAGQAGPADIGHLVVVSRDEAGGLQGGIAGRTAYRHFLIDVLWVHESARGTGLGRALMDAARAGSDPSRLRRRPGGHAVLPGTGVLPTAGVRDRRHRAGLPGGA